MFLLHYLTPGDSDWNFSRNWECGSSCLVVIHHFPGKRERSRFWQPVPSYNNPEFLSGTQLDKEERKRAEALEQLAPTEQRTWLWSRPSDESVEAASVSAASHREVAAQRCGETPVSRVPRVLPDAAAAAACRSCTAMLSPSHGCWGKPGWPAWSLGGASGPTLIHRTISAVPSPGSWTFSLFSIPFNNVPNLNLHPDYDHLTVMTVHWTMHQT